MGLYASLASSYDELFPLPPLAAPFLDALAAPPTAPPPGEERRKRLLDAGCATGSQALALASLGWQTLGIDSERAMIDLAAARAEREGLHGRASFATANMLEIGRLFADERFDLILCLGNTLPHLKAQDACAFLEQARALLAPGGALVLQIINFALPGIGAGYDFPTIAAGGGIEMRRSSQGAPQEAMTEAAVEGSERLRFVVELKKNGVSRSEETILERMTPHCLASLVGEAGFGSLRRFSGWDGAPFDESRDSYLIAVACTW